MALHAAAILVPFQAMHKCQKMRARDPGCGLTQQRGWADPASPYAFGPCG